MLKALKRALAAMTVLVLVPVEVVVRGVRAVVSMLVPQRNTAMLDEAMDVVAEAPVPTALQPTPDALAVKRATLQMSEGQRVRQAARALVSGGIVEKSVLDPGMGRDAQILEWIKILEPSQLQMLTTADPTRIEAHLDGGRRLNVPTLAQGVEKRNADAALAAPPLTQKEWRDVLMRRVGEKESSRYNYDKLVRNSFRLADRGWNMEHARRHAVAMFNGEQTAA